MQRYITFDDLLPLIRNNLPDSHGGFSAKNTRRLIRVWPFLGTSSTKTVRIADVREYSRFSEDTKMCEGTCVAQWLVGLDSVKPVVLHEGYQAAEYGDDDIISVLKVTVYNYAVSLDGSQVAIEIVKWLGDYEAHLYQVDYDVEDAILLESTRSITAKGKVAHGVAQTLCPLFELIKKSNEMKNAKD